VSAEPATGLITDEQLTQAAGPENSDAAVAMQMIAGEAEPAEFYGDSAYGTGDLRGAIAGAGHRAVIKPKPLQAPVKGGLTIDDFAVDEQAGTVTCPAGNIVALSRTRIATFGAACRDCPLRERCTTCKTGRKLVLHRRDDLLRGPRGLGRRCRAAQGLHRLAAPRGAGRRPRSPPGGAAGSSSATAG
jgi:hypothetical protein